MAASLVEMCHGEPFNEIQKKFRNSELFLLAWRSREKASQMEKRFKRSTETQPSNSPRSAQVKVEDPGAPTPDVYNEQGEPDMRKMTGAQQAAFLRSRGFNMPMVFPTPSANPQ